MNFIVNFVVSATRMCIGAALLLLAAGIPAYFCECGRETVAAAGIGTPQPLAISKIYLDAAKLSTAALIAKESGEYDKISGAVEKLYSTNPQWIPAGGNEPFFEAFYSSLAESPRAMAPVPLYSVLATADGRKKMLDFLSQTDGGLVKKFISMRDLNSVMFPPVYSSAGAPLEAALLINALLAQTGDFDRRFLREITLLMDGLDKSPEQKEAFEKYCLATLAFAKRYDWTIIRSIFSHFSSVDEVYDFAKVYESVPDRKNKNLLLAGMFVSGDPAMCSRYLEGADAQKWENFRYAFVKGEGALDFLLKLDSPIHEDWAFGRLISPICSPLKAEFAPYAAKFPGAAVFIKVALSIVGGYFFIRGFFRLFKLRRDTPKWYSPLALARGLLEALVVALTFFVFLEPEAFMIKIQENGPAPELRFALQHQSQPPSTRSWSSRPLFHPPCPVFYYLAPLRWRLHQPV